MSLRRQAMISAFGMSFERKLCCLVYRDGDRASGVGDGPQSYLCIVEHTKTGNFPTSLRQKRQLASFAACSSITAAQIGDGGTKKQRKTYVCRECKHSHFQWVGECRGCGSVNTVYEERISQAAGKGAIAKVLEGFIMEDFASESGIKTDEDTRRFNSWLPNAAVKLQRLSEVAKGASTQQLRIPLFGDLGKEISIVLGGGLVQGSVVLLCGDPGIGKSTLLLQLADTLTGGIGNSETYPVLYASGEESAQQIADRANRLNIDAHDIYVVPTSDLEDIVAHILDIRPRAVLLDSIQTVFLRDLRTGLGSVSQVKECTAVLHRVAKNLGVPIIMAGHVTKTGESAGPRVLEHTVDVLLYLEGERSQSHRLLRAVKNRFGRSGEVGVFEMTENGVKAISNPSQIFRNQTVNGASSAVAVTMEGSRPLFIEVQALCLYNNAHFHSRRCNGIDPNRLSLILAVLMKQVRLRLSAQEVHINVVGGFQLEEPAADLAIAVAISSSVFELMVPQDTVFIGEIGLGGELRSVGELQKRINEALKLGFKKCIVPQTAKKDIDYGSIEVVGCGNVVEVLKQIFPGKVCGHEHQITRLEKITQRSPSEEFKDTERCTETGVNHMKAYQNSHNPFSDNTDHSLQTSSSKNRDALAGRTQWEQRSDRSNWNRDGNGNRNTEVFPENPDNIEELFEEPDFSAWKSGSLKRGDDLVTI